MSEQETYKSDSFMFKDLDADEVKEFRQWARDNYVPGSGMKIKDGAWHPVVCHECREMEAGR